MGKIYSKYYNTVKSLRNSGILTRKESTFTNQRVEKELNPTVDVSENLAILKNDNCSWPDLEHHWTITAKHRLETMTDSKDTNSILLKWPQYKRPLGHKLIDIDFCAKFTQILPSCFNEIFIASYPKFVRILELKTKSHEASKPYFDAMKDPTQSASK